MKRILIMIIMLLTISTVFSQENVLNLSLDEAIVYALENNRTIINAERDIEAAKKQKWETTATGLPQVNASVEYQNFLKQPVSLLPAAAFDNTQAIIDTVEDFFNLTSTGSPDPVDGFIPVRFGTKQNINATVTLSQLLFDGSYLVALQSSKVFLDISKNAKEKTDLEVRKAVINAYGNVLLAEESIKILEKNKITLVKNVRETQKIYENGLEEEESVEQLQITLLGIESSLNNAIRLKDISYKMLNVTLGIDVKRRVLLKDDLPSLTTQNIDLDLMNTSLNLENNIDFKIAKNNEKSQELLLKYEKTKALPSLTAFVNGGYAGNSDSFSFLKSDQQWFGSSIVGVSLNVPIFSSLGRSAKTQRAKIDFEKAKTELSETEQQLELQSANAKSNYQFAIEQYQTAKKNLDLSERIEQKNQTKFFEGVSSSFELRQAQTQLYSAQQEYLQAMLDVINNKTALETVLNTIKTN
jgi:outer membrane protein TolC